MTCAVATFPEFSPIDSLTDALRALRGSALRHAAIGLGTVGGVGVTAALVTAGAVWVVGVGISVHPHLSAKAPIALSRTVQTSASLLQVAWVDQAVDQPVVASAPAKEEIAESEPVLTVVPTTILASATPILPTGVFGRGAPASLSLPSSGPADASREETESDLVVIGPDAEQSDPDDTVATASIPEATLKLERPLNGSILLRDVDSKTAVYDISANTVYMPDGTRLEAHSGLGKYRDDPDAVHRKSRGPTPPNVYDLKMRESLFHGVRAIRLNPTPGSTMYGRDGILAHRYMHGPNGQSQGCVTFKDYNKFLQAFLRGDVTRMVVVRRLGTEVSQLAKVQRSSVE